MSTKKIEKAVKAEQKLAEETLVKFEQSLLTLLKRDLLKLEKVDNFIITKGFSCCDQILAIEQALIEQARLAEQEKAQAVFESLQADYESVLEFDTELANIMLAQAGIGLDSNGAPYLLPEETVETVETVETTTPLAIYDKFFEACSTPGNYNTTKKNGTALVNRYMWQVLTGERTNLGLNDCLTFVSGELDRSYNSPGHFNAWQSFLRKHNHHEFLSKA